MDTARPALVTDRYAYLREHSEPALEAFAEVFAEKPRFVQFVRRLEALQYDVRFDTMYPPRMSRDQISAAHAGLGVEARYGLAYVNSDRPPLIYIIRQMHETQDALLDTLFHECIHATGLELQRFAGQPDDPRTLSYQLEEITAIYGGLMLAERTEMALGDEAVRSQDQLQKMCRAVRDRDRVAAAKRRGEYAAAYLAKRHALPSAPAAFAAGWAATARWLRRLF